MLRVRLMSGLSFVLNFFLCLNSFKYIQLHSRICLNHCDVCPHEKVQVHLMTSTYTHKFACAYTQQKKSTIQYKQVTNPDGTSADVKKSGDADSDWVFEYTPTVAGNHSQNFTLQLAVSSFIHWVCVCASLLSILCACLSFLMVIYLCLACCNSYTFCCILVIAAVDCCCCCW